MGTATVQAECPCGAIFIPMRSGHRYCTPACAQRHRRDRDYFGGRRHQATGMDTGTCQLCMRSGLPGLSAHHEIGKRYDPDNERLVALCRGCHRLVELLAQRTFTDDPAALERLVRLAVLRRTHRDASVSVTVEST